MIARESVNLTTVIGVREHDYQLKDGTTLIKSDDVPNLKIGDRVEISTDGINVVWNFIIN